MFSFIYFNGNSNKWSVHGTYPTDTIRNEEAVKLWRRNGCYGCDTILAQSVSNGVILTHELSYNFLSKSKI